MTVMEVDGRNVELFVVQNLFIYSRETYSVQKETIGLQQILSAGVPHSQHLQA